MAGPRPTGITILAVLEIIGGLLELSSGSVLVIYAPATGGITLLLGLLALAIGYGFWTGKSWGWTIGIAGNVIQLLYSVGNGVYYLTVYGEAGTLTGSVISVLISLIVLYYLFRPHVKAYFGKGATNVPPPPPPA